MNASWRPLAASSCPALGGFEIETPTGVAMRSGMVAAATQAMRLVITAVTISAFGGTTAEVAEGGSLAQWG